MIQGGCPEGTGTGGPGYTIKAEFNKTRHEPGVVSMARTSDPNSGGSQFFICLGSVPHLDGQYTAFGKTADAESLKVVLAIGGVATDRSDRPLKPVTIKTAKVLEAAKSSTVKRTLPTVCACLILVAAVSCLAFAENTADLPEVKSIRLGFDNHYKLGCWTPVYMELSGALGDSGDHRAI